MRQHIHDAEPLAELTAQAGISLRTAYKWLARYRSGGVAALADRRSVRRTQRRTLDPQQLQQAVDLRHQCCTLRRIARLLVAPLSTVGRTLKAMGLGRLKHMQPPVPVRRYQWDQPGDMIHVDIKQLARFERVGHGSREIGGLAAPVVRATKKLTSPSTMRHGLPMPRSCPMRSRPPRSAF